VQGRVLMTDQQRGGDHQHGGGDLPEPDLACGQQHRARDTEGEADDQEVLLSK